MRNTRTAFIILAFCFSLPLRAFASDYVGFGCAPWDGRTFEVNISAPDASISISIWMHGYEDLTNGKQTIVIDNKGSSGNDPNAVGEALIKSQSLASPTNVDVSVYFDELELNTGGRASGYVQIPGGKKYPFQGVIPPAPMCG